MSNATALLEETQPEESQFLETGTCPICGTREYSVIREAAYPQNLSHEALLKIYCSSSDHSLMDQLVCCKGCQLVYLNPRVKKEIALASYSSAIDPTFVKQNQFRIRTFSRTLSQFLKTHNIHPSKDKRVLDVGCAGGAFVKAAQDAGFTAMGIEPSSWMCEFGKKEYGLDLRAGILEDYKLPSESFDIITLWDVLEHVYTPIEVLSDCQRLLKPGGYLIINYPDYGSTARRLLGWKWPFFLSVHLFYFTPTTITKLLEKCGLAVVKIKPFWQTLELGYTLDRAAPYFGVCRLLSKVVKALGLGSVPLTYNMGQSMVISRREE
jgi:2-polyprenyl-3-methyl-5-hydroxy-6-metoxy-1,4-benzoquinol methylase